MFDAISGASSSSASQWPETFPVFAHQGGWDEVLLVGVPLAAIGILLWVANRRVNRQLAEASTPSEHSDMAESSEHPVADSTGS